MQTWSLSDWLSDRITDQSTFRGQPAAELKIQNKNFNKYSNLKQWFPFVYTQQIPVCAHGEAEENKKHIFHETYQLFSVETKSLSESWPRVKDGFI